MAVVWWSDKGSSRVKRYECSVDSTNPAATRAELLNGHKGLHVFQEHGVMRRNCSTSPQDTNEYHTPNENKSHGKTAATHILNGNNSCVTDPSCPAPPSLHSSSTVPGAVSHPHLGHDTPGACGGWSTAGSAGSGGRIGSLSVNAQKDGIAIEKARSSRTRLHPPYPQERYANKTRDLERERREEVLARTIPRRREALPACVLARMAREARDVDRVPNPTNILDLCIDFLSSGLIPAPSGFGNILTVYTAVAREHIRAAMRDYNTLIFARAAEEDNKGKVVANQAREIQLLEAALVAPELDETLAAAEVGQIAGVGAGETRVGGWNAVR
ncbi:hypothetical protein FIBSPDRAFT_1049524 [Athelia psychrophila]|uniref:Uncharacterized protein n=1 Tax=Athelia psychrophila TaxID=1759441 RepID=A0A166C4X6_9AGAM|nr:hypothetical protein FIBSPDRAFT_1049524 [Fibularhizoctonia sp. CBS 109695]